MATLTILIVTVFVVGYLCIALESVTRVNKAAIALLMCVLCWTLLMRGPGAYYPEVAGDNVLHHVAEVIEHHLGDAAGTLFFLMGAMTIVEIVDSNGGFNFVRDTMKTRSKRKLLWRVAFMTFFLSAILDNLRNNPITELGGFKVLEARDYKLHTVKNLVTGEVGETDLPESNVLYYVLENDQWCCVRPSGTEPKIKFYYGIKGSSMAEADELFDKVGEAIKKLA